MVIIVCLDDSKGMTFNKRRQSRDRRVLEDIARMAEGKRLLCNTYSHKLLSEHGLEHTACDAMLDEAEQGELCFVENLSVSSALPRTEEIVAYLWNRRYPADTYFDVDPAKEGFRLVSREDFEGYSHEKITKEIYRR